MIAVAATRVCRPAWNGLYCIVIGMREEAGRRIAKCHVASESGMVVSFTDATVPRPFGGGKRTNELLIIQKK